MAFTPERYAIREAALFHFYEPVTNKPQFTLNTLKMTEVETTGETTYAQGGRGNGKIIGFSSDRAATVTLQDALFTNDVLAALTGNPVTEGSKILDFSYRGRTDEDGHLELPNNVEEIVAVYPLMADQQTNDRIKEVIEKTSAEEEEGNYAYELVGDTLEIEKYNGTEWEGVEANTLFRAYYTHEVESTSKTVTVTADDFGGTFKVVGDIMVRDEDGTDHSAKFTANRVKVEDNFSFSASPDGDPSVLDLPLELLRDSEGIMWSLTIHDSEE